MHHTDNLTEPIQMGSIVEVHYLEKDFHQELRLVPPSNSDPFRGRMSISSPLGKAILGKAAGDVVALSAPGGTFRIRVTNVDNSEADPDLDVPASPF